MVCSRLGHEEVVVVGSQEQVPVLGGAELLPGPLWYAGMVRTYLAVPGDSSDLPSAAQRKS